MSVLIFFLVLFVLILVHEWGHFFVAKKTGMRVDEFGIGFPPKLFGIKKGETEYSFNAIPIGGFVRIYGENGADSSTDTTGSFTSKSKWSQAAVLIAGVTMNVIFAWLLFSVAFMIGVPTAVDEVTASDSAELQIQGVLAESPAAKSGIVPGSTVLTIAAGDDLVEKPNQSIFTSFVVGHEGETLELALEHNGENYNAEVIPEAGLIPGNESQPALGVSLVLVEIQRMNPVEAVVEAAKETGNMLSAIVSGLGSLLVGIFTGTADYGQVAGPIGIVGMVEDAAAFGVVALLMFTAVISLNLAVINLLPFPALDGGRLLFVAIEAVVRRPISPVWVARLNTLGFLLLLLLMVAVTYNDLLKIF